MTKKQIELSVLLQDLVLAFVINTAATILNGGFAGVGLYLIGMFQAFCINYVAGLILPTAKIGGAVAGGLGLKAGTLPHQLVRIFVINAIFVTIISFTIALINCGLESRVWYVWLDTYPALHIVGYLTSLLTEKSCIELAGTILGKEKEQ